MIKQTRHYIVDITNILHPFYYTKGFLSPETAKEAIDRHLPNTVHNIVTGKALRLMHLPSKRTPFSIHSPSLNRKNNGTIRLHTKLRRKRNRKNGIVPAQFKALWKPLKNTR